MDEALRAELLRRFALDQEAREALQPLFAGRDSVDITDPGARPLIEHLAAVDHDNTTWLRGVVDERGWPTVALVGPDGAHAAWLLVQHADRDPAFQERCLDLMRVVPNGEVSRRDIAYLTDRVRLAQGRPQVYGTQVHLAQGGWQPRDLEDPGRVDERRWAMSLEPLADYLAFFERQQSGGEP